MNNDTLSRLMDNDLSDEDAQRLIERMLDDPAMLESWETYHLIGDDLSGQPAISANFARKVSARLADEPTVLCPYPSTAKAGFRSRGPLALSLAASVAVIGFVSVATLQVAEEEPPMQAAATLEKPATVAANGADMTPYVFAHQELSPSASISGVTPYIRSVSAGRP